MKGSFLALAEARGGSGQDWDPTDLVMKRSSDGGETWSALSKLVILDSSSMGNTTIVIGNAAPVQLSTGRILVPFCVNNLYVLVTYSDDDGISWTPPRNISEAVTKPDWKWVGLGPPGAIQLHDGKVVVPGYHSYVQHDNGDLSEVHMMISEDYGESFRFGAFVTDWTNCPNEVQITQLPNGEIYLNARSLWTHRMGAWSADGGETFTKPVVVEGLTNPLIGCQGSTISDPDTGLIFYSGPTTNVASFLRYEMTLFYSFDGGHSFSSVSVLREGSAGYSSLQFSPTGDLLILYEWSESITLEFMPDHISFQKLLNKNEIKALLPQFSVE
jgi:sialidase-1